MIFTVIYDDDVVAIFKAENIEEANKVVLENCLEDPVASGEEEEALAEFRITEFDGDIEKGIFI